MAVAAQSAALSKKSSSAPAEHQTLIDVLVAKNLVERKCIDVRWLPNNHQFTYFLAKPPQTSSRLQAFLRTGALLVVSTVQQESQRYWLRQLLFPLLDDLVPPWAVHMVFGFK